MNNVDIRNAILQAGLKNWQVAERYGLHESNFSRKLRHELSQKEKERILKIIKELKKEVQ